MKAAADNQWASIPGADYTQATVSIVQAEDLNGDPQKIDAFCKVWIGKKKFRQDTNVYQNSDRPMWNQTFTFGPIISSQPDYKWLLVEVFDAAGEKPRDLGYFRYDLTSLKLNQTVKGWFTLKDTPKGKVLVEVRVQRSMDKQSSELLRKSIREHCKKTGEKYVDPDFAPTAASIVTSVPGKEAKNLIRHLGAWKRPCEFIDGPKTFCNGVESGDVIQGILGDCWFLGAASIVATRDDLLYPIVVDEAPDCGFYTFRFFNNGVWKFVTIDDYLPLTSRNQYLFAHCQDRQEIWVPLMEKAYAKINGCYQNLEGGIISQGLMDLTGEAAETFKWDKEKYPDMYKRCVSGEFFEELKRFIKEEQYLVGCSLQMDDGSEKDMGMGIMSGHAYSVLDVAEVKDDKGKLIRLLKIRNPWGHLEWRGDWSDDSPLWTQRLKDELNQTSADDGTFWIDWGNFIQQYNNLMVCRLLQDEVGHKWTRSEVFSAWVGNAAGGSSANRTTWHLAPQYLIRADRETDLFVSVSQEDRRLRGEHLRYPVGIGFDLRSDPEIPDSLPCILNPDKGNVLTFDHYKGREIAKCIKIQPGTYRLIPSVFDPNTEAKFYLACFSYWPVKLERIDYNVVEVPGEWRSGQCGGSLFSDNWVNNPKFRFTPEHDRDINVFFTLQQTSTGNNAHPMDIYVLRNKPGEPLKRQQVLVKSEQCTASKMLVVLVKLKKTDGPFLVVPVTSDPNQLAKFVLRVYSPIQDVCDLKEEK